MVTHLRGIVGIQIMLVVMSLVMLAPAKRMPELPRWLASEPTVEERIKKNMEERVKRPLMDSIHIMRMGLCYGRPDLITHVDCMEYMIKRCTTETSGQGLCLKLDEYVAQQCAQGVPEAKPYAKKLGFPCLKAGEEAKEEELDSDGDGHPDTHDAFPNDPTEWEDKNQNGIGDNKEAKSAKGKEDGENSSSPESPGPAPGPAAAATPAAPAPPPITSLDKKVRPLPRDGYDEYGGNVMHEDQNTLIDDWRKEWPGHAESEGETVARICRAQPDHPWCKLYLKDREHSEPKPSVWDEVFR